MKAAAAFVILILSLVVALIVAAGWSSDYATKLEIARGNAETARIRAQAEADAERIRAQGDAAINRAEAATMRTQAAAVAMLAAVPWGVLSCLGVLGLGVLGLAFVAVFNRPQVIHTPPQIITREIVYLPAPGQSRRELWRTLADNRQADTLVIPAKAREVKR